MENRVNEKVGIDDSYRILGIANSWINSADNKSTLLIALIGVFVGISLSVIDNVKSIIMSLTGFVYVFLLVVALFSVICYLILVLYALFNLMKVFIARLNHKDLTIRDNLASSISISNMDTQDYIERMENTDMKYLNHMILEQVSINSKIARIKMEYFNKALKAVYILVIYTVFTIILTALFS